MIAERARPANRLTVLLPSLLGHLLYNPIIPTLQGVAKQRLKTNTEPQSRLGVGENVGVGRELGVEAGADGLEDRANLAAEDRQDADNDNSDKNKDQCVLDQALAFLTSEEVAKHVCHPFAK